MGNTVFPFEELNNFINKHKIRPDVDIDKNENIIKNTNYYNIIKSRQNDLINHLKKNYSFFQFTLNSNLIPHSQHFKFFIFLGLKVIKIFIFLGDL